MNLKRRVGTPFSWIRWRWLPRRTVRLRLTLVYGALFIASGTALLAITYVLVWHATYPKLPSAEERQRPSVQAKAALEIHEHAALMHQLLASYGIGLAVTALLSIAFGWLVAGRVLRPLRAMTAATRRISDQNLHERLAVRGPDDELKHLGDTIDDLLARLEGAFDAQRRFVANASHELRTPLTMMRTALDVATNKPAPPSHEVTALAGKVRLGLDKADRLVENFLTLARAQYSATLRTSAASLDQIAATLVAEHRDAIDDQRLTVQQKHHHTLIHGNQALLTHLIDNLVDNAVRHNQPGGWIRVATDTDRDTARLVVENSGPILDQSHVDELLQPFRRLPPDRAGTTETGVGLGLAIVATIVTTHHGDLDLHARPDGGLRVTVTLPLAAQPALTAAAPA
jgi:hypothetical protein